MTNSISKQITVLLNQALELIHQCEINHISNQVSHNIREAIASCDFVSSKDGNPYIKQAASPDAQPSN